MSRVTGATFALIIFLGLLPGRGIAQISPNPEQQGQELQQVVESTFGPKYNLGYFVDVDHALKTESERFFDPQGTLQGTVLLSAIKGNMIAVGVYREGNVLWTDKWEAVCISGTGFNGTRDLNQDGTVELVYAGAGCRGQVTAYWIYSWDGQQGTFINKDREAVLTDFRSTGRFVDLTGDGILEIVGWREIGKKPVFENGELVRKEPIMERVAYSWNGQQFGQWPSTPEVPDDRGKLAQSASRDLMTIRVEASARPVAPDTLRYRYEVENDASSHQPLEDIHVAADSATSLQQPEDWGSTGHLTYAETRFARWVENGPPPRPYIHPGERGVVSYVSPGLPAIEPMYFQGHVEFVYSGTGEAGLEYITENSVSVQTIVARHPPDSTEYQGYLDTLRTYPDRARKQGWITTDAAANTYETRLDSAYNHLAAADSALAQQALSEVTTQAQADSGGVLTSEGYALLYYNADYLAQRLPASSPGCGQVPATAEINFETTSVWNAGYNAQIEITNTGDAPIRGWTLGFALEAPINSLWNGQLTGEAPTYTVADAGYNGVIAPGQSRNFGFQVQHDSVVEPTGYALNAVDCATDAPSVDIAFETTSVWNAGYNAQIAMTNTGDEPIRGWRLGFSLEAPIASLWNGQLTGEAPTYTVTDAGHNGVLAPGQTVTFGFQVQSDTVREPSDYAFQFWAVGP